MGQARPVARGPKGRPERRTAGLQEPANRNQAAVRDLAEARGSGLDRRRFLRLTGAAAAWMVLRPHEGWAGRAARAQVPLQPWSLPPDPPAAPHDLARALIGAAVLAPSDWNAQPWRFEVDGSVARIVADPARALTVTDPDRRGMMLALGAALENLLVAARAYGLRTGVRYFPWGEASPVVAEVTWSGGEQRRDRGLFAALTERRTNRRRYDDRGLLSQVRAQIAAQVPDGLHLHWIDDRPAIRRMADLAFEAVRAQTGDRRAEAECWSWMRADDGEARRRGDGVSYEALRLGGPARWMARSYFHPRGRLLRLGAGSAAKQERERVRSAGALALLTAPGRKESQWVVAGQAYERLGLKATQLGVAHQPLSAPIEVERFRGELLHRFATGSEEPLVLLRLGHAKRVPATPRRAVAVVTSFRNS